MQDVAWSVGCIDLEPLFDSCLSDCQRDKKGNDSRAPKDVHHFSERKRRGPGHRFFWKSAMLLFECSIGDPKWRRDSESHSFWNPVRDCLCAAGTVGSASRPRIVTRQTIRAREFTRINTNSRIKTGSLFAYFPVDSWLRTPSCGNISSPDNRSRHLRGAA